jgi:hypothetical protein
MTKKSYKLTKEVLYKTENTATEKTPPLDNCRKNMGNLTKNEVFQQTGQDILSHTEN